MRLLKLYILKDWKFLVFPIVGMFVTIGIDSIIPLMQQVFIDEILAFNQREALANFFLVFITLIIGRSILVYVKEYLFDLFALKVSKGIRKDLFAKVQTLEFSFFDKTNTGELMSRIGEDTDLIWETVSYGLRLFIEMVIILLLSSYLMFRMNATLAVICLSLLLPVLFMSIYFQKKFWDVYLKISDQTAELNAVAQQNIAGIRLVKAFAREKYEVTKFLNSNESLYMLNIHQAKLVSQFSPVIEFFCNTASIALIVVGGFFAIHGDISLGVITAFSSYILQVTWCVKNFGFFVTMLSQNKACMNRIFKILDTPARIVSPPNAYAPKKVSGDICFKNVSFKYDDQEVLSDINLFIPAGSSVAIMGATGCGKSTLLSLIGRYYDVTKGEVLVDGINVKEWDLDVLRRHLSVVFQDTFLFSDSIRNNIDFGEEHTLDAIKEAAALGCALDFIEEMNEGFNTEIGERGVGLSGGQKQRLTISRALLQSPSILILDDATSALDMETEYQVLSNISHSKHKSTTFIVAHRISGVKDANIILYMEEGRIVEKGTHQALLDQKGHYYAIYCDQFKEFITLKEVN